MKPITARTKLLGVIGNPIQHSLSPLMMNAAFDASGIDARYMAFEVSDLESAVSGARSLGFIGLNVTVPFKEKVLPFLGSLSPEAELSGAVNTIVFGGSPEGHSTDGIGAVTAIKERGLYLGDADVLILGAGGAAKAISFAIAEAGAEVTIANRTVSKAESLSNALISAGYSSLYCSLSDIPLTKKYSLIINATSVGLNGEPSLLPDLPKYVYAMDLVYKETDFIAKAKSAGAKIIPGLDMLLYQGAAAFELWFDEKAPVDVMRSALEAKNVDH